MKSFLKIITTLAAIIMIFTAIPSATTEAKVIWNGAELKPGQIGRLTVLKDTMLYKLNGTKKTNVRTLKAKEQFRIYSFLPGKLGLGGGYYIDRDTRVKYESPSKTKLQALGVKIVHQLENVFTYPQVDQLANTTAKKAINETIKKHIRTSYNAYLQLEADEKEHRQEFYEENGYEVPEDEEYLYSYEYDLDYEVKYNENNLLSIVIYDSMYTGGAHGSSKATTYNFDCLTGKIITLANITKTSTASSKIKKYAKSDLLNQANKTGLSLFEEYLDEITINNSRPFYFTDNGIVIKFFEYEVAPYSEGMPEVIVPYSVFK